MDNFLTIAPLVVTFIALVYFARIKMKKLGVIYVIAYYIKWFFGIIITVGSFYVMMITGDYMKEQGFPAAFSFPLGAFVWFIPMHYLSKFFGAIEEKFKKE